LRFTVPKLLLAAPPTAPTVPLLGAELPPFAITVVAVLNQLSPPAEALLLPAPTVTVYDVSGVTVTVPEE